MGLFTPFSYLGKTQPRPAWNPSDFTNVQYWWRADLGVTETGTGVSAWEDQINGFTMIQGTDSKRPTLTTSSNLNNAPAISFNGTSDVLYTSTAPASFTGSDLTMIGIWHLISATNGALMGGISTNNGTRFWLDTLNGYYRVLGENIYSPTASGYNVTTYAAQPSCFILRYDASAGDGFVAQNKLTETTIGTAGDVNTTWQANLSAAVGATVTGTGGSVFLSRYVQYELAEQIWIHGSPSTAEMEELRFYVNNRYGTLIA